MPQIIVTASIKGGTGKSTNTVLLGRHLAETGRRVLIIDLDPQASATDYFCRTESADSIAAGCTYHLLTERAELADIMRPGVLGLDIAPAAPILSTADIELAMDPGPLLHFRDAISMGGHDVVLIDCPPMLSAGTRAALFAADRILVPVQLDRWTLQGLAMLHAATIKATRTTGRPCPVQCVPSIVTPKETEELRAVLTKYDITQAAIPRSASVRRAVFKAGLPGRSVVEAVAALATEIVGE